MPQALHGVGLPGRRWHHRGMTQPLAPPFIAPRELQQALRMRAMPR
jgi:hypothetical protein